MRSSFLVGFVVAVPLNAALSPLRGLLPPPPLACSAFGSDTRVPCTNSYSANPPSVAARSIAPAPGPPPCTIVSPWGCVSQAFSDGVCSGVGGEVVHSPAFCLRCWFSFSSRALRLFSLSPSKEGTRLRL